jgi:putative transposase
MSRYRFVEAQRDHYPVRLLCQLVEVLASGYYAWQKTKQQVVTQLEPAWETALVKVFGIHKHCYGTRRLRVELRRKGYRVGRQRLRVAMRRRGLHALQPKAFTPRTTDSTHGLRCAPNRLLDQPKPIQANRVWVSDTTYLPLANGDWLISAPFKMWLVSK